MGVVKGLNNLKDRGTVDSEFFKTALDVFFLAAL